MFKEALHGAFQGHQTGQEQKGSLSMKGRKKLLQQIAYVVLLLAGIVILFHWYSMQNSKRMEERNKNYAADSARQTASRIDEKLENALDLISKP